MKFEYCEKKINELSKQSFLNSEQKNIFLKILKNVENDHDRADVFNQLFQRVKVGLTFDEAPLYESNNIYTLNYIKSKSIICSKKTTRQDQLENSLIIGENYEVLNNLLITHKEKIDIIYIDPPYNTNEFTTDNKSYKDKFTKSAWLTMMKERLILAKKLLKFDGIIFISIDDNMQAYLKVLMDEIFGEEKFIANINWQSSFGGKNDTKLMPINTEYILLYGGAKELVKYIDKNDISFKLKDSNFSKYGGFKYSQLCRASLTWYKNLDFIIYVNEDKEKNISISFEQNHLTVGKICAGPSGMSIKEKLKLRLERLSGGNEKNDWRFYWSQKVIKKAFENGFIEVRKTKNNEFEIKAKIYEKAKWNGRKNILNLNFKNEKALRNIISNPNLSNKVANEELKSILNMEKFSYPKPSSLLKKIFMIKSNNSIILDFFAGSGTTGHAVMELNKEDGGNRKFILCTNNENDIDKICYERLYRIIKGYGTNNEKDFKWLNKNEPYLVNMNYYNLKHYNIDIHKNEDTLEKIDIKPYKILNPKLDIDSNNKSEKLYELIKHINKIDE